MPFRLFLVVWGRLETIEIDSPRTVFMSVDLPQFGLPASVTKADLKADPGRDSTQFELSFSDASDGSCFISQNFPG